MTGAERPISPSIVESATEQALRFQKEAFRTGTSLIMRAAEKSNARQGIEKFNVSGIEYTKYKGRTPHVDINGTPYYVKGEIWTNDPTVPYEYGHVGIYTASTEMDEPDKLIYLLHNGQSSQLPELIGANGEIQGNREATTARTLIDNIADGLRPNPSTTNSI